MLVDVARAFSGTSRLQLWTMERDETEVISARIFLGAGTHLTSWLAGFDDEWAVLAPGFVDMVAAIEHTWSTGGYQRIDLGVGTQHFKFQIADGAEQVEWKRAVRKGWRPLHTPTQFVPWEVRRRVSHLERSLRA
jgi:CelD/BcsL family acetyltransferase involved in cellulose biosynthesis